LDEKICQVKPEVTCHSEVKAIKSVFVKSVTNAFIDIEKISREWKMLNYLRSPDFEKGKTEFNGFENLLEKGGAELLQFPKDDSLSLDSIYCRDASIATNLGMIICNMGKEKRKGEPQAQLRAYLSYGIPILGSIREPGTLEGGDVAWIDENTLAAGLTYRTNEEGIKQLKEMLLPFEIDVIPVPLPHYKGATDVFHLMSILSPVDDNLAVVYSPLMPIVFRKELLNRGFELVEVPEEEFDSMGCNVLAIAPRNCVMVKGNPKTKTALEKAGCKVTEYEGAEISVNGGGGPTCLTRPIWRRR
jgi:N-dimethylarginine dimethylaminohydrolase